MKFVDRATTSSTHTCLPCTKQYSLVFVALKWCLVVLHNTAISKITQLPVEQRQTS